MSNHYCPHTQDEIREMLAVIGVQSIEELFTPIPLELRAKTFNLPSGMSEFEANAAMQGIAADNQRDLSLFIGGGFYDHLIPAVVDHLAAGPSSTPPTPPISRSVPRGPCRPCLSTRAPSAA